MIEIRDPSAYGMTRDDIIARAGDYKTKEGLFAAACTELFVRILAEVQAEFAGAAEFYEMLEGSRPVGVADEWDCGLLSALGAVTPEMYQHHLSDTFPDLDAAAVTIAGWAVKGMHPTYNARPGAFLAKLGIVAADWERLDDPAVQAHLCDTAQERMIANTQALLDKQEEWVDALDFNHTDVSGLVEAHKGVSRYLIPSGDFACDMAEAAQLPAATREDVARAWVSMASALEVDQREQAKQLGVSRSTVSNYGAGKTLARCTVEQAVYLAADCRMRANALLVAAGIFERVR